MTAKWWMQYNECIMINALWLIHYDKCNVMKKCDELNYMNVIWWIQCDKCNFTDKCDSSNTCYEMNAMLWIRWI